MNENIVVTGIDDLEAVGRKLKDLGSNDLRWELYDAIDEATAPLRTAIRRSAAVSLPKRGGLARRVAASTITTTRDLVGASVGVRVVAVGSPNRSDIARIDRGTVRHPVYGNVRVWVTQRVRPGWFSRPAEMAANAARREIVAAVDDIARRL